MNVLHTRWRALVLALLLAVSLAVPAAAAETETAAEDLQTLADTAASYAAQYGGAQSLQYALWQDGEIILTGHAGNYSRTENRALTDDILYGVGSVSKTYTAAAVLKLVDEGKVELDAPVTAYLPDFTMADGRYTDITVRMLLNHSSGLPGSTIANGFLLNDPDTLAADTLLEELSSQTLKADPGAFSVYCNDGFTLAEKMQRQAERFGAQTAYAQVERMELTAAPKALKTSEGTFYARTVILATGANPRELGLAGEEALVGRGVAYCAACDGMRYKGKTVAVVGGGNSAAGDALLLSRIAERVVLVHRRDQLRATKIYHEPLIQAENVEFRWNSTVTELLHEEKLTGIRLRDVQTGAESVLPCDGLFISVGRKPATELVKGQLELDAGGYVTADETTRTNLPGVYAVGDVRTKPLRQVVTAVADGAMAVHMAEEYLAGGA